MGISEATVSSRLTIMFQTLAYAPLGIWVLALLIILADSMVLLRSGEYTYRNTRKRKARVRVAANPFLLRGYEPVLTLLAYPCSSFWVCVASEPKSGSAALRRALKSQYRIQREFVSLTIYSSCLLFFVLFVGPILSLQVGLERSIITVWPIAYLISVCVLTTLWFGRRVLRLSPKGIIGIGAELLFCPFLAVNIWKKIAIHQIERVNATALIEVFADEQTLRAFRRAKSLEDVSVRVD